MCFFIRINILHYKILYTHALAPKNGIFGLIWQFCFTIFLVIIVIMTTITYNNDIWEPKHTCKPLNWRIEDVIIISLWSSQKKGRYANGWKLGCCLTGWLDDRRLTWMVEAFPDHVVNVTVYQIDKETWMVEASSLPFHFPQQFPGHTYLDMYKVASKIIA